MNDITFDIYKVVVIIIGFLVGFYLIPALKRMANNIQDEQLRKFVKSAVYMAQQTMKSDDGTIKFNRVRDLVTEWLNDHRISITDDQLDILIESAVLAMKTETK